MLKPWLDITKTVLEHKQAVHVSGKKIARLVTYSMPLSELNRDLITIDMLGFAKKKITMLTDYYYNKESIDVALSQLKHRREKGTYGSCGVTTYNHFAKKERPQHGPCIQSIVFTHLPGGIVDIDVFYRTTEVFKKFAADLIFLQSIILPQFKIDKPGRLNFHFANATYHPMYWVVSAPYFDDPVSELHSIKIIEPVVWRGIIRWAFRFVSDDPSLLKFKQGQRVAKHLQRLMAPDKYKALEKYIRKHRIPTKRKQEEDEDE